jgi:hypothetical protein
VDNNKKEVDEQPFFGKIEGARALHPKYPLSNL